MTSSLRATCMKDLTFYFAAVIQRLDLAEKTCYKEKDTLKLAERTDPHITIRDLPWCAHMIPLDLSKIDNTESINTLGGGQCGGRSSSTGLMSEVFVLCLFSQRKPRKKIVLAVIRNSWNVRRKFTSYVYHGLDLEECCCLEQRQLTKKCSQKFALKILPPDNISNELKWTKQAQIFHEHFKSVTGVLLAWMDMHTNIQWVLHHCVHWGRIHALGFSCRRDGALDQWTMRCIATLGGMKSMK